MPSQTHVYLQVYLKSQKASGKTRKIAYGLTFLISTLGSSRRTLDEINKFVPCFW